MSNRDVFVVIVKDPCGAVLIDSVHHQAVGRGLTYGKVGAVNRVNELRRNHINAEFKRIPTGSKLDETYKIEKW